MNIIKKILDEKVYSVIRVTDPERAVEIAEALYAGGIKVVEIIVSNAEVLKAIEHLNSKSDMLIAAGGIITQRQATTAIFSGAKFIVSPIFQMNLVRFCQNIAAPMAITATTPNEAYTAWKARIPLIKIYPTKPMGGAEYVEDLLRPMPFLNIIASGSIAIDGFTDYYQAGAKVVGIGRALYNNADRSEIIDRAKEVKSQLNKYLSNNKENNG